MNFSAKPANYSHEQLKAALHQVNPSAVICANNKDVSNQYIPCLQKNTQKGGRAVLVSGQCGRL